MAASFVGVFSHHHQACGRASLGGFLKRTAKSSVLFSEMVLLLNLQAPKVSKTQLNEITEYRINFL
jgi:hypothetical protein